MNAVTFVERLRMSFAETDIPGDRLFPCRPGDPFPSTFLGWEPNTEDQLRTLHRATIICGRNELEDWPPEPLDFDDWIDRHLELNPNWLPSSLAHLRPGNGWKFDQSREV